MPKYFWIGYNKLDKKDNRSLSKKGCPYDNAVAEATYKIIKTEFAFNRIFGSFEELETELFDYVHWYNNLLPYDIQFCFFFHFP